MPPLRATESRPSLTVIFHFRFPEGRHVVALSLNPGSSIAGRADVCPTRSGSLLLTHLPITLGWNPLDPSRSAAIDYLRVSGKYENVRNGTVVPLHRFWRVNAIAFFCVLIAAAILNLIVDPFSIYGTALLPRVEVNHYERKVELFREFEPKPNVLLLGSSRVYSCDPDIVDELTGQRCFSFSVPSSKAETFYAILRMALEDFNAPVDMIIIAVDPESFHPTMSIAPESRFVPEYAKYFIYHEYGQATPWERVALLFTLDQTGESIGSLRRLIKTKAGWQKMEFRDDGYATWIQREREIAQGTFDLEARLETRVRKYPERSLQLSSFTGLGEVRKRYWEDFMGICEDRGIKVYAFMPPVHPQLLELLDEVGADALIQEVADYVEETVTQAGGVFRDYTDIRSFGGDPDLFYDEIHMRPQNGERLLRHLLDKWDQAGQLSSSLPSRDAGVVESR